MSTCSNSVKGSANNDIILSFSVKYHVGLGGQAQLGFNITEFFKRLYD